MHQRTGYRNYLPSISDLALAAAIAWVALTLNCDIFFSPADCNSIENDRERESEGKTSKETYTCVVLVGIVWKGMRASCGSFISLNRSGQKRGETFFRG